jgi:hypothetical protein
MNQDITPKPRLHRILSTTENTIMTMNFKKAELYISLNTSMIICVRENAMYRIAGAQSFSSIYSISRYFRYLFE